jgi:hypothetical protein
MLKIVVKTALAASLAAGGMVALTAGVASAGGVTITAGAGSSASCGINATAKLAPALKNNWNQDTADNVGYPAVQALPTTTYAEAGPVAISAKSTGTCTTGTATNGTNTANLSAAAISIAAVPGTGSTDPASCSNLIADSASSTQKFDLGIKWSTTTPSTKITATTITNESLGVSTSPVGFGFSGGTITGSFAGGTVNAVAAVSGDLIAAVTQPQETGAQAAADSYTSLGCEPTLKYKAASTKKPASATLKGPKGLKAIVVSASGGSELTASA